jgi:hypothetical protein
MIKLKSIPKFHGSFKFIFATCLVVFMPIFILLLTIKPIRVVVHKLSGGSPELTWENTINQILYEGEIEIHGIACIVSAVTHLVFFVVFIIHLIIPSTEVKHFVIDYADGTPVTVSVRHPYCVDVSNKNGFDYFYTIFKDTYLLRFNYEKHCGHDKFVNTISAIYGKSVISYDPHELVTILRSKEFLDAVYNPANSKNLEPQP